MSTAIKDAPQFNKATPVSEFRSCLVELRTFVDTVTDGTVEIQKNELILSSAIMASTAHPRDPSLTTVNIRRSELVAGVTQYLLANPAPRLSLQDRNIRREFLSGDYSTLTVRWNSNVAQLTDIFNWEIGFEYWFNQEIERTRLSMDPLPMWHLDVPRNVFRFLLSLPPSLAQQRWEALQLSNSDAHAAIVIQYQTKSLKSDIPSDFEQIRDVMIPTGPPPPPPALASGSGISAVPSARLSPSVAQGVTGESRNLSRAAGGGARLVDGIDLAIASQAREQEKLLERLRAIASRRAAEAAASTVQLPCRSPTAKEAQLDAMQLENERLKRELARAEAGNSTALPPPHPSHILEPPLPLYANGLLQDPIRTHERKLVGVEFVDDDGGKHLVFRSTAAFDNAPNSNFIRRMTSIPRLLSAMSGEGLLLDSDKFRKQLVGNARQSSFGIIAVNPTWASEYDLSKLSSLPVIKSSVEFDKLLRGGVDTLSSYTDTGKIDNLSHLEKALMNIELVFAAVFDNSWRGCNQTPLLFLRTQDIQLIPLGFPVTYLEMAMKAFNDLVKNKYIPNPDCPTHPKSLQSLQSVLQLWKALIDPVVSTCTSPTQLNVYYRLYGYNNSMGRVPTSSERESLAVWGSVLSDKPKGILKKQARSDSDGDSIGL